MVKKKRKKTYTEKKNPKRPENFRTFSDCVKWLKRSVYLVVRARPISSGMFNFVTLGSGFVAAPYRFVTAGHVMNDMSKDKVFQHQTGDKYYLIRHDDEANWHYRFFEPTIDKELFIYPEVDLAILYLDEDFYGKDGKIFADKNDFIRISKDFLTIGNEVGVLGYPLCQLDFQDKDSSKPILGDILLRTDRGVVNCRYKTPEQNYVYEFTLGFNPGNSGGPIFDPVSGRLVSIVKGFHSNRINQRECTLSEEESKHFKVYKEKSFIETLMATYSFGFGTPTFLDLFVKHKIIG